MTVSSYNGRRPKIHPATFVADTAAIIGDVEIGPECGIWFGCTLRGDVNIIRIGARTNIQDGSVIHVAGAGQGTFIGDDVTVGHMVLLHACTVETGAFIGMKACVMDDALVVSGAMVAAGALVTPGKRVPAGEIWAGNPARLLRQVTDKDRDMFARRAADYVTLARRYRDDRDI